jgi:hypothetical protein
MTEKLIHIKWFFSDKAWFSLRGEVNSQNNRYWSAENPRFIYELPLHDERNGVWCAKSARRITGPIFYNDTVNAARYVNNILSPFFAKLTRIKAIQCSPAGFSNSSYGIYKFGSTVGSFRQPHN